MTDQLNIAEVIPLIRLPRRVSVFDYRIPPRLFPLQVGQIVSVPFRQHRNVQAVVFRIKAVPLRPPFRYHEIGRVVTPRPWVSPAQLQLAQWISAYYVQSLPIVMRAMVPDVPWRVRPETQNKTPQTTPALPILEASDAALCDAMLTGGARHILAGHLRLPVLVHGVHRMLSAGKQTLLLVPELQRLEEMRARLSEYFPQAVFLQPTAQQYQANYNFWEQALSGVPLVVVGTRRAVFAPVTKLAWIVMLDEDDGSYKQWDQNPRYHAREVALKLAELTGARVLLQSITPTCTSRWRGITGRWSWHADGPAPTPPPAALELVDLRVEHRQKNFSPLCSRLQEYVARLVPGSTRPVVLFVSRKGTASFVRCRDCGFIPGCDRCAIPYAHDAVRPAVQSAAADLVCRRCGARAAIPTVCPACRGVRLDSVGVGVQRVVLEVLRQNARLRVARLDADVSEHERARIRSAFAAGGVDVLVATTVALGWLSPHSIDVVAAMTPDANLLLPDYRAGERAYRMLRRLLEIARDHFLVQTNLPQHPVYTALRTGNPQALYEWEISNREQFRYPPFSQLISLTYRHADAGRARHQASRLQATLQRDVQTAQLPIDIVGPQPVKPARRRQQTAWRLILKVNVPQDERFFDQPLVRRLPAYATMVEHIPDDWIIDVDPEEL